MASKDPYVAISCGNCYYYVAKKRKRKDAWSGECRRWPPVSMHYHDGQEFIEGSEFPPTIENVWCGEFQTIDEVEQVIADEEKH